MKNVIISTIGKLAVAAAMGLFGASAVASDGQTVRSWQFATSASPIMQNGATATVALGSFSSGWLADMPALPGGEGGFWDLGQNGKIVLHFPDKLAGSFTVRVSQWWDGSIYEGFSSIVVLGAKAADCKPDISRLGSVGGWIVDETVWTAEAAAGVDTIEIQSGAKGAVIDSVLVESEAPSLPPTLAIRIEAGNVLLSWPASAMGMTLESTEAFSVDSEWKPVQAEVQVADGVCSAMVPMESAARFYRLNQQ